MRAVPGLGGQGTPTTFILVLDCLFCIGLDCQRVPAFDGFDHFQPASCIFH
jgi:hypothetical protein